MRVSPDPGKLFCAPKGVAPAPGKLFCAPKGVAPDPGKLFCAPKGVAPGLGKLFCAPKGGSPDPGKLFCAPKGVAPGPGKLFCALKAVSPATPGQPSNVTASGAGATNVLVIINGARRANSFNYYKQVMGTDPEPVKVQNVSETQFTIQALPSGATVQITVTGVNDAGEGPASTPVSVVVP